MKILRSRRRERNNLMYPLSSAIQSHKLSRSGSLLMALWLENSQKVSRNVACRNPQRPLSVLMYLAAITSTHSKIELVRSLRDSSQLTSDTIPVSAR